MLQRTIAVSRRQFIVLAAGLFAASAGCTSAAPTVPIVSTASSTPTPREQLNVGVQASINYAPIFIGVERGYFQNVGLDLNLVLFRAGTDMIAPLAQSQLDICVADPSAPFLNAAARGIGFRFTADGSHSEKGHSSTAVVVRKDLADRGAVKDIPDLVGLKLESGAARGGSGDALTHFILSKYGLKDSDVDLQYLPFPEALAALTNGALDAANIPEQLADAAIAGNIAVRLRDAAEILGPQQILVAMYSSVVATSRQDAGKRFMLGYLRGVRDYMDAFELGTDKDAIVSILTRNTAIQDPTQYAHLIVPAIDRHGHMDVQSMKDLQQWWVDNGYIQSPANMDELVDTSYVESALKQLDG